jgi:hypothetical protein
VTTAEATCVNWEIRLPPPAAIADPVALTGSVIVSPAPGAPVKSTRSEAGGGEVTVWLSRATMPVCDEPEVPL